ncbi:two-component system sensor protein [Paraburkholderia tropica]|uniref:sensor histidine kinase n=1 Tax=Paraburkholderia tropica TaxID=92647 RepID=UPI001CB4D5A3|nr:HAMP domain-containing sensor histidine kinase [Paraburkholderia tropica]CAG9201405.1 two-component system sensor protein [Paraburkholderia tropica]
MRADTPPTANEARQEVRPETRPRRTLARDFVLAYLVLALLVGGLLSLVSMWTVNRLETHLQQIDMGMALDRVRDEYLAGKSVGRVNRFFHGEPGSDTFPTWLRDVEPGFSRLEHGDRDWHVMADDHDGVRYMLLRDYTAFEERRVHSHWLTVLSVGASLLVAFLLGGAVTRRFVRPLIRLAEQVVKRPALPPQTRLAHAYPENEIGRLAAAFDATYNELEAALQREKLFTADVSHELRTPLTVISSSCELLLDDPALTPTQRTKLERAHAASRDIHQQLAAYLMLSRGSATATGFAQSDVASVAREEIAHWSPRATQLGLRMEGEFAPAQALPGMPNLFPAALLRIVLSNLIRNALQHAANGTRILVHADTASFEVADDGPGIAASVKPHLFTPFVRGGEAGADNLGLGLSLVQRICEHQGWRITLDSSPGAGTRFRIELTASKAAID